MCTLMLLEQNKFLKKNQTKLNVYLSYTTYLQSDDSIKSGFYCIS